MKRIRLGHPDTGHGRGSSGHLLNLQLSDVCDEYDLPMVHLDTQTATLIAAVVAAIASIAATVIAYLGNRSRDRAAARELYRDQIETAIGYVWPDEQTRLEIGLIRLKAACNSPVPEDASQAMAMWKLAVAQDFTIRAASMDKAADRLDESRLPDSGIDRRTIEALQASNRMTVSHMRDAAATMREGAQMFRGEAHNQP